MHQIRFRMGLHPRPRWGSLQCSPDPLAGFRGLSSKGGGEWKRWEGRGRPPRFCWNEATDFIKTDFRVMASLSAGDITPICIQFPNLWTNQIKQHVKLGCWHSKVTLETFRIMSKLLHQSVMFAQFASSANHFMNPESSFLFLSSFRFRPSFALAKEIPVHNR